MEPIPVSNRAVQIEYAIRDVVVPATELEKKGHKIIKLNIATLWLIPAYRLLRIWFHHSKIH